MAYRAWRRELCADCQTRDEWFDDDPNAMYAEIGDCRGCEIREFKTAELAEQQRGGGRKGGKVGMFPDLESPAGRRIVMQMAERD